MSAPRTPEPRKSELPVGWIASAHIPPAPGSTSALPYHGGRQPLRDEFADALVAMMMHASHAVDYAERGCDGLATNSFRHVVLYCKAANAHLKHLLETEQR